MICWLRGHVWFPTVITHHDAQRWPGESGYDENDWYRGVWHERICLRCQKNEAVYQRKLDTWNVILDDQWEWSFQPTEHFPLPEDW